MNPVRWLIIYEVKKMLRDVISAKWLEGHRTQVTAVSLALLTLALNLGWITQEQYTNIMGFLVSLGLITASVHKPK